MTDTTTVAVTMPQMGDSVTEGTILEWHKQEGDRVEADETIVEVSTDKVDAEVPAPAAGVVRRILVQTDETVAVGSVLAEIAPSGGSNGAGGNGAGGNGAAPAAAPATGQGDESAVEEAEHGPAAEEETLAALEAVGGAPDLPEDAPGQSPSGGAGSGAVVDVTLPAMGDSVAEGTILEWHKQEGDRVEADEVLVEVSTDKVDLEVPAPAAGTVAEILVAPDETVAVGALLARIATGATATSGGPSIPAADGDGAPSATAASAPPAAGATGAAPAPTAPATNGAANASPVAHRVAGSHGVDLSSVRGTGPRGRVTKEDVLAFVDGAAPGDGAPAVDRTTAIGSTAAAETTSVPAEAAAPRPEPGLTPLRGPAATLARFMNESRGVPTATSFRTIPVDVLDARRRELREAGHRLSFTHLIAWAIVRAARDMPEMGRAYVERDGKPFVSEPGALGLGLAVDIERKDGTRFLVTPVLAAASELDLRAFVTRYDELVAGARHGTLPPDAYQGANVTLTNPGGLGTHASVPRLMPGQGTIVAAGAIGYPPGFGQVDPTRLRELGITKVMTLTSTYDHRVIQGAQSGAFLARIEALLSGADRFYEQVSEALADGALERTASPVATNGAAPAITAEDPVPAPVSPGRPAGEPDLALLQAVQAATSVVKAFRMHGHLAAHLDPLGSAPVGDPALDPATVNLTPELMEAIPASVLRVAVPGRTFAEALPHLQQTYCGTIAYEVEHISDHEQRVWLRQAIESGEFRQPLSTDERRRLLDRLSHVEAFETYLHKTFLGRKQFSIEGLDVLVPMLDETIEQATRAGAREVVLGMAHRGRLNVLAHTVGRPYQTILVEFEGEQNLEAGTALPEGGTGDVKYHHGASGTYSTLGGRHVTVTLSPNPSHLEFVDPVVQGRARADQSLRRGRELRHDPSVVLPVLMHGDAAFPGQGVVAETLNLQGLPGYSTGGTVHIITNNQLGFTTEPSESRSTRYASDLAKGFDVPVIHVNADDVEACISAVRLAHAYRSTFGRDAVIDLIGYRRFGHNETDEPAYTQPDMYATIRQHPPVRRLYAERLVAEGVVGADEAEAMAQASMQRLAEAHDDLRRHMSRPQSEQVPDVDASAPSAPPTTVAEETLRGLNERLFGVPDNFNFHRKLRPQFERRRKALDEGTIEWAQAEALALASVLRQGVPVRLTGQDTERGTFSQRHLVLHDAETGERYVPIENLYSAEAPIELHNSPLSEAACLGFEYGYSAQAPEALVLWEAQFGDFVNGAQVIIDQFIVSGLSKWGQTNRLTLLLPHGYEGAGPEHSSGRLERFLQLASEGNMRVANCTTPAQYFHLLRRQALVRNPRPLVVMTPKSLLRLPAASSGLQDLTHGSFQPVIDDPTLPGNRDRVTRLVLCSGKVYYDIVGHEARSSVEHVAVARVELLYPFAEDELRELIGRYPNVKTVAWVQEEPRNMGARLVMEPRIKYILPLGVSYEYEGRPLRASPGEGYAAAHAAAQANIVRHALDLPEPVDPAEELAAAPGVNAQDPASGAE